MSCSGIIRLAIIALSRAGRFDCQVGPSPEAKRAIDKRQLFSAVELEVLQQDAAVLQTERAFPGGPARDTSVRRAVRNAGVHVPAAEFHVVQMKIAAPHQLSQ